MRPRSVLPFLRNEEKENPKNRGKEREGHLLSPWGVVVLSIVVSLPLLLPHFQQSPSSSCRSRSLGRVGVVRNGTSCRFSAGGNRNGKWELVKRNGVRKDWEVMGRACRRGWKRERPREGRVYAIHCFFLGRVTQLAQLGGFESYCRWGVPSHLHSIWLGRSGGFHLCKNLVPYHIIIIPCLSTTNLTIL